MSAETSRVVQSIPVGSSGDSSIPIAIPSLHDTQSHREIIVDGKVRIRRVDVRGDALFPQYGVSNEYISKRLNRFVSSMSSWMSVSEMHRLADDLTLAYHEKGLTFVQVFVLPQEIRRETLTLNVLAGRLSEVNVLNNRLYSTEQIAEPFTALLGKVIYEPAVKQQINRLNRLPGLKVFGFYSMGRRQGETRLNLRVQAEEPQSTLLRLDNWGVQDTGVTRLTAIHSRNNVSGRADVLQALVMGTNESGNVYGGLNYSLPLSETLKMGVGINSNQFEIAGALADFGLQGHLETALFSLEKSLLSEQFAKANAQLTVATKQSTVSSDEFREVFEEQVNYTTLEPGLQISVLTPLLQMSQGLYVAPFLGIVSQSNNDDIDKEFYGLKLNYSVQHLWSSALIKNHLSTLSFINIYTPSVIPGSERLVLTGGNAVRGYDPALFSADQSYRVVLEHFLAPMDFSKGIKITPFMFIDGIHGEQNDEFANTADFFAAGIGCDMFFAKTISSRITAGFPVAESSSSPLAEKDFKPVIFGYLTLQF